MLDHNQWCADLRAPPEASVPAVAAAAKALGRRPPSNRFKPLDDFPNIVPPPYRRSYASATAVARPGGPAALTSTADHVPDPTNADLARLPVAADAADTAAVTTAIHAVAGVAANLPRRSANSCPPIPTATETALTDSACAPISDSAADQLPTPTQPAPSTNADDADDATDATAALAAVLTAQLADVQAQLALLRVQDAACKAKHVQAAAAAMVQHAASMAIKRAQLVRIQRHATDALQQGQLTALASAFSASVRHKAAHAAESRRIAASLPQRFDPPLPARNYHPDCVEAKLGLRSVGEAMTLRGTLARATFRPPRFPRRDPLPRQTEAMRQSKAKAMRQSKARANLAMRQSPEVQPTCKYATWTRRNHLRLTLA